MNRLRLSLAACLFAGATALVTAQTAVLPTQEIVEALKPVATRGVSGARASLSLAIQFEPNSPRVLPVSGPMLGNLVAALLTPELQASRFVIEGHGEPSGSAQANQRLSQQRAEEVRLYLVALGVPASRLRAAVQTLADSGVAADARAAADQRIRVVAHD